MSFDKKETLDKLADEVAELIQKSMSDPEEKEGEEEVAEEAEVKEEADPVAEEPAEEAGEKEEASEEEVLDEKPEEEEVKKSSFDKNEGTFDDNFDAKGEKDVSTPANGGGDVIKNKKKKDDKVEKMYGDKKKMKKKEDEDEEDEKVDMDKMKKEKDCVKKSISVDLSQDDYELLQKARKDQEEELRKKELESDPVYKSISGLVDLVKSQNEKIENLTEKFNNFKRQPARSPKALDGLKAVEKGEEISKSKNSSNKIKKSSVMRALDSLQRKGQIDSSVVAEYEYSNTLNDRIREMVLAELEA